MKLIERNHDIICHENDLEHLFTLENFPVFMGCKNPEETLDLTTDMKWWISKKTGVIQLNPLIPLDVLYSLSHNSGVVGKIWSDHHKAFSSFIQKYCVENVLEIGAGHGELCKNYTNENQNTKWTII